MSDGSNASDDDDDLAKLMPNVAKLIRSGESNSLESKGSTTMSFSGNTMKQNIEMQNLEHSRQRQGVSVFREVANKYLRKGETIKRASKPRALATLSSNCRVESPNAERWRNKHSLDKENVRPEEPTLNKQSTRGVQQQKVAMREASQKVARKFRKLPSHSEGSNYFSVNSKIQRADKSDTASGSEHLAQTAAPVSKPKASCNSQGSEHLSDRARKRVRGKAKMYRTTMPLNLSELKEEFAKIDGETLEEEEESIPRMPRIAPVVAPQALLDHGDGILGNGVEKQKELSRSEQENLVNNSAKARVEVAVLPHEHRKEAVGNCTSQSVSRKSVCQDQDVPLADPAGKGNDPDAVVISGHDPNAIPCPMSTPDYQDADDRNQGDNDKCLDDLNPPSMEQNSARPSSNRSDNQASVGANGKFADTKSSSSWHKDTSGRGTNICAKFEVANGEGNDKIGTFLTIPGDDWPLSIENDTEGPCQQSRKKSWPYFLDLLRQSEGLRSMNRVIKWFVGCSPTQPNLDNPKVTVAGVTVENGTHREASVPHPSSTFRDARISPPKAPEQEDAVAIPLYANFCTQGISPISHRLHKSRGWRTKSIKQRRLAFESDSESKQQAVAMAVDGDSSDVSVTNFNFKGRTKSAVRVVPKLHMTNGGGYIVPRLQADNINHDGHDFDAKTTGVLDQEAKLTLADGELDDRNCEGQSSKSQAASRIEGVVDKEELLTDSLAQKGNLPALEEGTGEMGTDPFCFSCPSPKTGRPNECLKIRGVGKRTWAILGAPIDGGRKWKEGRKVSTRIKSRPLDWWRGERMLYGRVHSTLCTLIGIKTTSPDPGWPRPKAHRGDYTSSKFHVDSFVDDSHCELLRLAAQ